MLNSPLTSKRIMKKMPCENPAISRPRSGGAHSIGGLIT